MINNGHLSDEDLESYLAKLNSMVGLAGVKEQVNSLVNLIRIQNERRERNLQVMPMSYHLVFTGNPGTGKTTVARLLSKIYASLGIVTKGTLVETDRAGLVAGYVGQTAIKTEEVINKARGGILFIDEAYTLAHDQQDQFGMEAIDCLMKRMEDFRDDLVVIVAGYAEPMNRFLESNPGLKSRFNTHINFEDYTCTELAGILIGLCNDNGYSISLDCLFLLTDIITTKMEDENFMASFSNGRYIRNLFEKMVKEQGNRLSHTDISTLDNLSLTQISVDDLQSLISSGEFDKTF